MDADSYEKCLALWREIARRYRDRWIVGGYDLLNEPIDHASDVIPFSRITDAFALIEQHLPSTKKIVIEF